MEEKLNDNDNKLLALCSSRKRSIGEIARALGIAPKNVSTRIDKLLKLKKITIERRGKGKKTYVRTKETDKTNKFILEILQKIDERGEVSFEDYALLPGFNPDFFKDPEGLDKSNANMQVLYSDLIQRKIRLSDVGKKFLEENLPKE